jgi:hypothetical protein
VPQKIKRACLFPPHTLLRNDNFNTHLVSI